LLYTASITAPINTPKTSPTTKELKVKAGYITKIQVLIPSGHSALAHLAIRYGETRVIPWGDDEYIEGDAETVPWEEELELRGEPVSLTLEAWNQDDTYEHTFYVRIWVEGKPRGPDNALLNTVLGRVEGFMERVLGAGA